MTTPDEIQLLVQAKELGKKYKEILRITGQGYNIFSVLQLQANETRLHSAFIADLLNPSGMHGQKDVFLKLFLEECTNDFQFFTENVFLEVEKSVGFINEDKTEGGRIDIYLTDNKGNYIFIENKIYAGDQENQLVRYSNHNKKAKLIYLSLSKKTASKESYGELEIDKDFIVINYEKHIISWLQKCRKEAIAHPILRETIFQYINLIKILAGDNTNENMKQELAESFIRDRDSLEAAFSISNSIDRACDILLEKRLKPILKEIADELNITLDEECQIDFKENYSRFQFYKEEWEKAAITFQFQSFDKKFAYGLSRGEEVKDSKSDLETYNKLKPLGGVTNAWWFFFKWIEEPFSNWENKEPWLAIIDGSIKDFIKNKIATILTYLGDASV